MFKSLTTLTRATSSVAARRTFTSGRTFFNQSQTVRSSNSKLFALAAAGAAVGAFALMQDDDNKKIHAEKIPHYGVPGTNKERTFIAIKPDGVHRGAIAEIISRFEKKGYKLVGIKVLVPSRKLAEAHYEDLNKRPFFPSLVNYFTSGPVVAMVWEGTNAIAGGRVLVGATNPKDAVPGTVRGDLCLNIGRNMIHGSDSAESAKSEISLWFKEEEVANYDLALEKWVYESK